MRLRIAISGSAGTGKTTLARLLARRLGLSLIPEALRAYLEAGGIRLEHLPPAGAAAILASFRQDLEARADWVVAQLSGVGTLPRAGAVGPLPCAGPA